jgi:Protein of unknown function (DUF2842)
MDYYMTPPDEEFQPSWRKPAGVGVIMLWIVIWSMLVVSALDWIGPLPTIVSVLIYAVAGIAWIAPLRPILIWMETGRFIAGE